MTIPDYQTIMLPLLALSSDGRIHRIGDAVERLALQFKLTPEERSEPLPSGRQARFVNRVGWARTYLTKANVLESPGRGLFKITSRGEAMLAARPSSIGVRDLEQFPEYLEFKNASATKGTPSDSPGSPEAKNPEELIEDSVQRLTSVLAAELLQEVKSRSPAFFEHLVVELLVRMGYGGSYAEAGQRIGRSGDGGIDGIIKEDRLGLDIVYLQAKRWEHVVSRPDVQGFAGSLAGHHAQKGVMLTTSRFTQEAIDFVRNLGMKIVLIDGDQFARYMIEHSVGVAEVAHYSVKRLALEDLSFYEPALTNPPATAGETLPSVP